VSKIANLAIFASNRNRMKNIVVIISLLVIGCSTASEQFYGEGQKIDDTQAVDLALFVSEMESDSSYGIVTASVQDVCQAKGCWMKVAGEGGEKIRVSFKDYGFFVPKDCQGKEVVLEGFAYTDTVSVAELQHYAQDAGKTEEEIAAITEPEITVSFEAAGVILR
jgi:hypothetical protein